MPWKYTDDYYREYTRTTWNDSAEAYVGLLAALEPFRKDVLNCLSARPGERILDLGTGPGEPAMTIASQVHPGGHVTGVDLSENMVSIASKVARSRGLQNIDFQVMDCAALSLPDSSFDAATSCFGFQIFTDPERAAREARRVLRPGGRICVCVWGTGDRVPFLHALVGPMLEFAEPDETGYLPTPYETGGPGEMVRFLEEAGFREGVETRVEHRMNFANADDYLRTLLKATPIGHSLEEEDSATQQEVLRKTRVNLERWTTADGVSLPAECVIVTANR